MTRKRSLLLGAGAALAASATVAFSTASFNATTANPNNSFSAAASFCANPGSQTVTAVADTYVSEEAAGTNFGSAVDMRVRSRSGGRNRRALVRFNLPSTPAGCSMSLATLRLYSASAAAGRTIQVYRAAASWAEMTVNWTNQPATTGSAVTSASGTGWRTWDVTSQVSAMYSGQNNGFLVRDAAEGANGNQEQVYQTREGVPASQVPELVVTFN